MQRSEKLAVLMPVFNGGRNLLISIQSCAKARINGYEIIVIDNCSTDGVVDTLPPADASGAPIHIVRNETNIGRVRNWTRAVEIAVEMGFTMITFLFAGDCWRSGTALSDLLKRFRQSEARVAFAPFVVTDEGGHAKQESRRFYVADDSDTICSAGEFVSKMLEGGMFPLGPIQANLYRVDGAHRLWFDPGIPTRADVEATLTFIQRADEPLLIGSAPFLNWREHAGRFHASMGPARTIEDYMETFHRASLQGVPMDRGRAKARVVLNSIRLIWKDAPVKQWPQLLLFTAKCSRRSPYRIKPSYFVETLWCRFARGQKLLSFG